MLFTRENTCGVQKWQKHVWAKLLYLYAILCVYAYV